MQKIKRECLKAVRRALDDYQNEVHDSGLRPSTKKTYCRHAETFVRWLEGDFHPGHQILEGTSSHGGKAAREAALAELMKELHDGS